jgi:hypothetical protein
MANNEKKVPWGDALAPFERQGRDGELGTVWIDLGPVWQGENGSLQLTLLSEPLHWRAHASERRIVIKPREPQQQPSNTGRRGVR